MYNAAGKGLSSFKPTKMARTYRSSRGTIIRDSRKRGYSQRSMYARGRRTSRFAMVRVPRGLSIGAAPYKMVRKMHMQYNRVLNNTADNYVQMEIHGNSLVNPILEAEAAEGQAAIGPASEQVYGKDEIAALYEDYVITGATVCFTLVPTSTVTNLADAAKPKEYPIHACVLAQEEDDTSHPNPTTVETFKEHGAKTRLMGMGKHYKIVDSRSTNRVLGGAAYSTIRTSLDDQGYPARRWKWILHLEPFASVGASEAWEVAVKVDVYYTVHFLNRKQLTQSSASAPA